MLYAVIILILFVSLLFAERLALKRARERLPLRVLVNGTRGKSSVTEYIAAAMRAAGMRPFAKITGILPTMFYPDGTRNMLKRFGPARVQEQSRMLLKAASLKADSIVLECMSINPEYQNIERQILRPNIYVITNIGDDHREEMGETIDERIASICTAIPENGLVITIDDDNLGKVKLLAAARNAKVITADRFVNADTVPPGVFPENINLACEVLKAAGITDSEICSRLLEYVAAQPAFVNCLYVNRYKVDFINGFPVNDTPSADRFIEYWKNQLDPDKKKDIIVLFNTRADRPKRTRLFCEWFAGRTDFNRLVILGNHKKKAIRILKGKIGNDMLINSGVIADSKHLEELLLKYVSRETIIFGIGNIAVEGFKIIDAMRQLAETGASNDN